MSTKRSLLQSISLFILAGILFYSFPVQGFALDGVPRSRYLDYAMKAADHTWKNFDKLIQRWKQGFDPENVFGYRPPGGLLEMAVIYAYLYGQEKNPEYAQRSKKIILTYADYRSAYPEWAREKRPDYEDGIPMLPDFFTVMRFLKAYDMLKKAGFLSA